MSKRVVLLVGGAGAIGAALLERLLADDAVTQVFATCSREVCSTHAKLQWLRLDYTAAGSIRAVAEVLREKLDRLDHFVCASGYLHGVHGQPEKSISTLEVANMEASYRLNVSGPLELFARCAPLLKASNAPRALFLSAQIGSIEDNRLGGWFSYRMAKAALNMGIKTAAIEAGRWRRGAAILAVHPGTTRSALSKPFVARRKQPIRSAADSARHIYRLLCNVGEEHNGAFLTAEGRRLPW
jgi:NAD(P)-dependent dehydrogenase (short-subunit alcohol dehydrogenase family)